MSVAETLTLAKTLKPKIGDKTTTELIAFIEEYKHGQLAWIYNKLCKQS